MASFSAKLILALAALLVLTTSHQAHGLIPISQVTGLVVRGVLHCGTNPAGSCGSCPGSPALANIRVSLTLNGQIVASVNTDLNGVFQITIPVGSLLNNILSLNANLRARVALPIVACPIWASVSAGVLEGPCDVQGGNLVNGVLTLVVSTLNFVPLAA